MELNFYACAVPVLDQYVLARFLDRGYYEQHLSRMRKEYRARRAAVMDAFTRSTFASRIEISEQGAGLHFLLRLETSQSDAELRERAAQLGVRLGFLQTMPQSPIPHTLTLWWSIMPVWTQPGCMKPWRCCHKSSLFDTAGFYAFETLQKLHEKAALRALPPKQFCGMIPATRLFVRMFVPLDSPYFYNCLWLWAAVDSLWFP